MANVDIKICSCGVNCEDVELLNTNKSDDTKENLLEVAENTDLLEVKTGVPSRNKTMLYPKRDITKVDTTEFTDFKEDLNKNLNENFKAITDDVDNLVNEQVDIKEELKQKAEISSIPDITGLATKEEVSLKADRNELPDTSVFATKEEVETKADRDDIPDTSNFATISDLNKKANIGQIPDTSEFVTNTQLSQIKNEIYEQGYATQEDLQVTINAIQKEIIYNVIDVELDSSNRVTIYYNGNKVLTENVDTNHIINNFFNGNTLIKVNFYAYLLHTSALVKQVVGNAEKDLIVGYNSESRKFVLGLMKRNNNLEIAILTA